MIFYLFCLALWAMTVAFAFWLGRDCGYSDGRAKGFDSALKYCRDLEYRALLKQRGDLEKRIELMKPSE